MLNPNARSLYTSALMPPPGMVFDEAIATSFSMDPTLLLEAPVYLALLARSSDNQQDPISVVGSIRRYSNRITAYVQRGRILVPSIGKPNPLFGLLEPITIEVSAPNGGVFHPKVWLIRFTSSDGNGSESLLRLMVLSRNLTNDRFWDLSLQLEGRPGKKEIQDNKPLCQFISQLPKWARRDVSEQRIKQAQRFADEIHRTQWEPPGGFDKIAFYVPGMKGCEWKPAPSCRMAIISPYCSDDALTNLVKETQSAMALISRPETLQKLSPVTLKVFRICLHLDEAAETEDGETVESQNERNTYDLCSSRFLRDNKRPRELALCTAVVHR
jgi:hypothetical protein